MAFVKVVERHLIYNFAIYTTMHLYSIFLENRTVKHALTGIQIATTGALERDAADQRPRQHALPRHALPFSTYGPGRATRPEATHAEAVLALRRLEACPTHAAFSAAPHRTTPVPSAGHLPAHPHTCPNPPHSSPCTTEEV
jgi:hypothetical protein